MNLHSSMPLVRSSLPEDDVSGPLQSQQAALPLQPCSPLREQSRLPSSEDNRCRSPGNPQLDGNPPPHGKLGAVGSSQAGPLTIGTKEENVEGPTRATLEMQTLSAQALSRQHGRDPEATRSAASVTGSLAGSAFGGVEDGRQADAFARLTSSTSVHRQPSRNRRPSLADIFSNMEDVPGNREQAAECSDPEPVGPSNGALEGKLACRLSGVSGKLETLPSASLQGMTSPPDAHTVQSQTGGVQSRLQIASCLPETVQRPDIEGGQEASGDGESTASAGMLVLVTDLDRAKAADEAPPFPSEPKSDERAGPPLALEAAGASLSSNAGSADDMAAERSARSDSCPTSQAAGSPRAQRGLPGNPQQSLPNSRHQGLWQSNKLVCKAPVSGKTFQLPVETMQRSCSDRPKSAGHSDGVDGMSWPRSVTDAAPLRPTLAGLFSNSGAAPSARLPPSGASWPRHITEPVERRPAVKGAFARPTYLGAGGGKAPRAGRRRLERIVSGTEAMQSAELPANSALQRRLDPVESWPRTSLQASGARLPLAGLFNTDGTLRQSGDGSSGKSDTTSSLTAPPSWPWQVHPGPL